MSVSVVYDTMLFLQQAARPARVHASFQAVRDGRAVLSLSAELLAEVQDVLTRPKHQAAFPALTVESVTSFLDDIVRLATVIDPVPNAFTWLAHPDDDHLFNLAIASRAEYLVTWETRLLNLPASQTDAAASLVRLAPSLSIITPKQLADLLRT